MSDAFFKRKQNAMGANSEQIGWKLPHTFFETFADNMNIGK